MLCNCGTKKKSTGLHQTAYCECILGAGDKTTQDSRSRDHMQFPVHYSAIIKHVDGLWFPFTFRADKSAYHGRGCYDSV